jgi:hypothetical protein
VDSLGRRRVDSAAPRIRESESVQKHLGIREPVAVVVTADGRRVQVPATRLPENEVSLLGILRLIGLGLLALITGSGEESGGRRRDRR